MVDRNKRMGIVFEGRRVEAFEGDTVASALQASGLNIFSRSFKYHRPRGLFCVSGRCPNCMVAVDGVPNIRACTQPVRDGMKVRHQNAWPSLDFDLFSGIQRISRFMPVGFYYKTFINFPIEWRRVEERIRHIAGLGSIEEELARWQAGEEGGEQFDRAYLRADLVVIGGGPAGVAAALEGARSGAKVILVDDQPTLGGHLRFSPETVELREDELSVCSGLRGYELARKLDELARAEGNLTVLSGATAFGLYESNQVGVVQGKKMIKLRGEQVVVATGANESVTVFRNNDLPGVFLGGGVLRLIWLYGVRPGDSAVVVTNNPMGAMVARSLIEAGVKVVALADSRPRASETPEYLALRQMGTAILAGHAIAEATGSNRVRGAVLVGLGEKGEPIPGTEKTFACDTICLTNGVEPDLSLLTQARCKAIYDESLREFVPSEHSPGVRSAGDVTGVHDLNCAVLQGRLAALDALAESGKGKRSGRAEAFAASLETLERAYKDRVASMQGPPVIAIAGGRHGGKEFVCLCEDVPEKDLVQAVYEGFDDIETLKRYSTFTMGPCEGRMCSLAGIAVCARETGRSVGDTGRTVARPPHLPVAIGALSGRELHPVKLTPMHHKHLELGATMMDMGEWKRPLFYTSVADEHRAVRERVGIIDLSTLGRLDVRGRDAPALLDLVYTHTMSKLSPGKSRYGVICDDGGVVLDDGTVTRLSEDHYFVTTSTGNIDFVEQWFTWWATAKGYDVHVTNLTSGYAAVNVAGPRARELLSKLADVDLSNEAFPYMGAAQAQVAGVPCILLRIGFVGETGWEVHFPAQFGEYLWDAILEAGEEFAIRPFGVETQRVLRLEKKHVIVGQDTDALSNPYEADMAWVVRLDKPDYIGKAALTFAKDNPGQRKLVGFLVQEALVPHDGDQAFSSDGAILLGTVTSTRYSPVRGRAIGMALIDARFAKEGERILIRTRPKDADAIVTFTPFYDPEGKRLKS